MRKIMVTVGVAASVIALGAGPAAAKAASGTPQRPEGQVITSWTNVHGPSNGWGNCGHNASGGKEPTGTLADGTTASPTKGLGGYGKSGCPLPATTTVVDPVTGAPITGTTEFLTEDVAEPETVVYSDPVFYSDSYGYDAV